jgi:hypothetical protein
MANNSNDNLANNQNNKALMINIKKPNYNQYKLLNLIGMIHRRRVLNHIKKFMIWMI